MVTSRVSSVFFPVKWNQPCIKMITPLLCESTGSWSLVRPGNREMLIPAIAGKLSAFLWGMVHTTEAAFTKGQTHSSQMKCKRVINFRSLAIDRKATSNPLQIPVFLYPFLTSY